LCCFLFLVSGFLSAWILVFNEKQETRNQQSVLPMRALLSLFLLLILSTPFARAQTVSPRVSANFILGIPVNEFADNVDNVGFGLNVTGGVGFNSLPLMIGLDVGYMIYGFERRSEPFSTTIPDVRVDVETSNNIVLGHLVFRVQPQQGTFQPYLEGLFGFKYLFTSTSIKNEFSDERIASSTNFDDFASSYGAGAGMVVQLFQRENERGRQSSILLHLGARYLLGSNAEYLEKGSIERLNNGDVVFNVTQSRTDLIMPMIGATFTF